MTTSCFYPSFFRYIKTTSLFEVKKRTQHLRGRGGKEKGGGGGGTYTFRVHQSTTDRFVTSRFRRRKEKAWLCPSDSCHLGWGRDDWQRQHLRKHPLNSFSCRQPAYHQHTNVKSWSASHHRPQVDHRWKPASANREWNPTVHRVGFNGRY